MKTFTRKFKLLLTSLLLGIFIFSSAAPIEAQAKITYVNSSKSTKNYFSDVKSKTKYRTEINWLASKGAFKGIAKKGKKFNPNSVITRRQFCTILDNLYGDKINLRISSPNAKVTQKFSTSTLTTVSKQLGTTVSWRGGAPKAKVTRGGSCYLIYNMIKSGGKKLQP